MKVPHLLCIGALLCAATPSHLHAQGTPPEARDKIHHLFDNHAKVISNFAAAGWEAHDRTHAVVSGGSSAPGRGPRHCSPARE